MTLGKLKNIGIGIGVEIKTTTGPSSYDATNGHQIVAPGTVIDVIAILNTQGNYQVKVASTSGSTIVLRYYTISADTTTGAISATEVSGGTDLSSLSVKLIILYA